MASPYRAERDPEAPLLTLTGHDGAAPARLVLYRDRVEQHTRSSAYELKRLIFLAPDVRADQCGGVPPVRRGELVLGIALDQEGPGRSFAAELKRALPPEAPPIEARGAVWRCRRDAGYLASALMLPCLPLFVSTV